ncbi:39S ribosomal protein L52, mitochondrial [Trachymyrmex septentrionalis]|uniref:Large ribosomal subunit protein mL52 n=1 Tax=Trachymyrmex septentrionalis TaxID=34720 RepID=A0A195F1S2_9HYME|nr:39S ribosomal protein L52, mitochondrial [Trachymyrmex septentrionalis]
MISTARAVLHVERHISYNIVVNGFHQSCVQYLNQKWRQKRGLTVNPNTFGLLTNMADYTFKDGRPTPLGVRQKARLDKQRGYAIYAKIVKLVREVDFAVERHARIQEKKKEERQEILNNKLKPKGDLLLQIQTDTMKK